MGIVAQTIANGNRDSRSTSPYSASDFMQEWGKAYWDLIESNAGMVIPVADKVEDMMRAIGIVWT